ncbi:MAG: M48 family metallopeptidase [Bacteroidota bacterium]
MKKSIFLDLLKLIALFGVVWAIFVLLPIFPDKSDLDLSIEKEEKLGTLIVDDILSNDPAFNAVSNPTLDSAMSVITNQLFENIGLTDYEYNIIIIDNPQVNAFTLPGGYIFVFSGLIEFTDYPEELAAVLAHEIGHVEKRHVVTKLIKEFGLTFLFTVLTGGDAVILSEVGKTAVSTVFDRKQEKEADLHALDLLTKSNISPQSLAAFFRRLKREVGSYNENFEIIMTHPHVNSRIKTSIEYKLPEDFKAIDFDLDWEKVKKSIGYDAEL